MKLAIGLVTADRADVTRRTLETFSKFNPSDRMPVSSGHHLPLRLQAPCHVDLIHADDASVDPHVRRLAELHGFERITSPTNVRQGGQRMRYLIVNEAARRQCTHVMILENDWESVRPIPWDAVNFSFSFRDVYCMRLYGVYRERDPVTGAGRRACNKSHMGKGYNTYDPGWKEMSAEVPMERLELGDVHWGAPPAITRIDEAVWLHEDTRSEAQIRRKCARFDWLTVRVTNNVFYHIGDDRTPGFKQ